MTAEPSLDPETESPHWDYNVYRGASAPAYGALLSFSISDHPRVSLVGRQIARHGPPDDAARQTDGRLSALQEHARTAPQRDGEPDHGARMDPAIRVARPSPLCAESGPAARDRRRHRGGPPSRRHGRGRGDRLRHGDRDPAPEARERPDLPPRARRFGE